MKKLILIGGLPRSGTSLVRRIIGSHSRIGMFPVESHFLQLYMGGKTTREILSVEKIVQRMPGDISDLFSLSARNAFIKILTRYSQSIGKDIAGDKTPLNEFYYDLIQEWFSDLELKFIHLIRNPFDMAASYRYAHFRGEKAGKEFNVSHTCENWCRSVSMGLARSYTDRHKYHVLKYEEIVINPVKAIKDLCIFLGVNFEKDRMISLSEYDKKQRSSFSTKTQITNESASAIQQQQSRKQYLTDKEISVIGSTCGELARAIGYVDDDFISRGPKRMDRVDWSVKIRNKVRHVLRKQQ